MNIVAFITGISMSRYNPFRPPSSYPLKRTATAEDIAAAVSFLCSTDADYITGQALNVDGGIEMN